MTYKKIIFKSDESVSPKWREVLFKLTDNDTLKINVADTSLCDYWH